MGATFGLLARAGTPKEVMDVLASAFEKTSKDQGYQSRLDGMGFEYRYMTTAEASKYWDEVVTRMQPLVLQARPK